MITSAKNCTKINIKMRNKLVADSKPRLQLLLKSTASILGWFVVYSGIPQMQSTSSWLWGFNPLLLRLHREISLSLLCLHSSWGSALVLAPPLCVGCPQASVPCPDRRGLKQWLIRGLLLTQAGGGRGTECGASLQQQRLAWCCNPQACGAFSQGICPCIMGPWQWWAAQAPRAGWVCG